MSEFELEQLVRTEFDLAGYSDEDVKNSGFYIVAKIWIEDNSNADDLSKKNFVKKRGLV